jgi:very-short-patch-repair endonuclease
VPNRSRRGSIDLLDTERTVFKEQLGLALRAQVLANGVTDTQIVRAVAQGRWLAVAPGLYALANWPAEPTRPLLAACLATRGVASHASAAWVWGLLAHEPPILSVSVPHGQWPRVPVRKCPGPRPQGCPDWSTLVVHQSRDLPSRSSPKRLGVPTTNPLRSLVDLAGVCAPEVLDEAIDVALAKRLASVDSLLAEAARLRRRGRSGPAQLIARLQGRGFAGAPWPSVLESRTLRALAEGNVKVDQCEVVVDQGRYRLDIQVGPWLFVEVDGYAYHWAPEQKHRDDERRNQLRLQGCEILVYDWGAVVNEPSRLLKEVKAALRAEAAEAREYRRQRRRQRQQPRR